MRGVAGEGEEAAIARGLRGEQAPAADAAVPVVHSASSPSRAEASASGSIAIAATRYGGEVVTQREQNKHGARGSPLMVGGPEVPRRLFFSYSPRTAALGFSQNASRVRAVTIAYALTPALTAQRMQIVTITYMMRR